MHTQIHVVSLIKLIVCHLFLWMCSKFAVFMWKYLKYCLWCLGLLARIFKVFVNLTETFKTLKDKFESFVTPLSLLNYTSYVLQLVSLCWLCHIFTLLGIIVLKLFWIKFYCSNTVFISILNQILFSFMVQIKMNAVSMSFQRNVYQMFTLVNFTKVNILL